MFCSPSPLPPQNLQCSLKRPVGAVERPKDCHRVAQFCLTPSLTLNSELPLNIKQVTFPHPRPWWEGLLNNALSSPTSFRPFLHHSLSSTAIKGAAAMSPLRRHGRADTHLSSFASTLPHQRGPRCVCPPPFPEAQPPQLGSLENRGRLLNIKSPHITQPLPNVCTHHLVSQAGQLHWGQKTQGGVAG